MIRYFKRGIYILLFCFLATLRLVAQDPQYFVYIQHEKSQPFYVKYKGKVLSSSERGYIILSELPAGTLPVTIGFVKGEEPEQQFKIKVTKDDQGFLLKRTDEKSYALYNLQTFAVTMAGSDGGESGRLQPVENTAAAPADAAPQPDSTTPPATETAAETVTPAPPAADTNGQAMMAALRKDLDSAMAGKADVSSTSKPAPEKKSSKFAQALDKVVSDDRPDDIPLEEPATPAPAPAVTTGVAAGAAVEGVAAAAGESRKNRRKRNKDKEREPLTEEEQSLLKDVMAEEQKAAQVDSQAVAAAPATDVAAEKAPPADTSKEQPVDSAADQPVSAPAQVPAAADAGTPVILPATEEVPEKKSKRSKKKKDTDPQFIEFMDDSTQQRVTVPAEGAETAATPAQATGEQPAAAVTDTAATESKRAKRKKRKLAEMVEVTENPNNIVKDSVDYDAPRRKEEKKAADGSALKMINSDCENLMDDATFRKLLRRFVSAKDDEGMVDAFRRNTRGYCLETNQVRRLAQLVNKDEYRYQLLDLAYPKAYDSENYAGLSDLLVDSYYQGRFKAMLHK